eukprot:11069486-Lingulodinium_polyedra.AAC.1
MVAAQAARSAGPPRPAPPCAMEGAATMPPAPRRSSGLPPEGSRPAGSRMPAPATAARPASTQAKAQQPLDRTAAPRTSLRPRPAA